MNSKKDIILIIGASSSIGKELIDSLDLSKSIILAHYHSNEIKKEEGIYPLKADLGNESEIINMINYIKKNELIPNKIIHIASDRLKLKHYKKMNWDEFQLSLNIQIKSFMMITKDFLPYMSKSDNSKVITILSSVVLSKPPSNMASYVTTKYALLGLTKALASEYPKVAINSISPSMIETDFLSDIPEIIIEMEAKSNPHKRNARVNDIIKSIKFLLDNDNSFMSGVNLPVTGGMYFS